jgi:hypothetical protein
MKDVTAVQSKALDDKAATTLKKISDYVNDAAVQRRIQELAPDSWNRHVRSLQEDVERLKVCAVTMCSDSTRAVRVTARNY